MAVDVEDVRGNLWGYRTLVGPLEKFITPDEIEEMLDEIAQLRKRNAELDKPKYKVGQLVVSVKERQVFEVASIEPTFVYHGVNVGVPSVGIPDRHYEVIERDVQAYAPTADPSSGETFASEAGETFASEAE